MRPGRLDQDGEAAQALALAEKRAPPKPPRFSSLLPDSQELLDIRTKKKAGVAVLAC